MGGWDPGSGYVNDADLLQLSNSSSINDVMLLEFDFIPEEDTMIFDYAFASGEYTTFTCTAFNDVFGFFLSGPGISGSFMNGAVNIAVVPGTETPIAINTVNSGIPGVNGDPYYCESMDPNWLSNSVYFQAITSEELLGFNGMTVTLQARYVVTPGASYHIKLAIGDAMDTVLDSGVFLKAASFRSVGGLPTAIEENTDNSLNAWFDESGRLWIDRKNGPVSAVTLHDIQGRLIARSSTNGQERVHIMLPEIPGGIYFVEAQFGDRQWHRTLIKAEQ